MASMRVSGDARLTMKGACGMPRELVSTLDWDGPAMADDAEDMIATE